MWNCFEIPTRCQMKILIKHKAKLEGLLKAVPWVESGQKNDTKLQTFL